MNFITLSKPKEKIFFSRLFKAYFITLVFGIILGSLFIFTLIALLNNAPYGNCTSTCSIAQPIVTLGMFAYLFGGGHLAMGIFVFHIIFAITVIQRWHQLTKNGKYIAIGGFISGIYVISAPVILVTMLTFNSLGQMSSY